MSSSWADLRADQRVWSLDDPPAARSPKERPEDAGAWPESMGEVKHVADRNLTIPGQSEAPAGCGEWGPKQFCQSCGEVHLGPHQCGRKECEDCWFIWRTQAAESITIRLQAARRAAEGWGKRAVHVVVSPPEDSVSTIVDYERMLKTAYQKARDAGVRGGVAIPHGWRVKEDVKEDFRALKDAELVDGGIWRAIREASGDWRSKVYWSPHVHIIGLSEDVNPDPDDDWITTRVSTFGNFGMYDSESYEDLFRCAAYLLSHLGMDTEDSSHSIRWFGELANNQFSPERELKEWEVKVIQRHVWAISGTIDDPNADVVGEPDECDSEDCNGFLESIWLAPERLLDAKWCDSVGSEKQKVLNAAHQWAIGESLPPPGLKHPQSRDDAEEALSAML